MSCRTQKLLPGSNWKVVVHNQSDKAQYLRNPHLTSDRLIVSNVEYNVAKQRQFVLDALVKMGEWFLMLDDNINEFQTLLDPWYDGEVVDVKKESDNHLWRWRFRKSTPVGKFLEHRQQDIEFCEERNCCLMGYASNDNHFFRYLKHQENVFCNAKMLLIKKSGAMFPPSTHVKCDYAFTVENVIKNGSCWRNNYVYPVSFQGEVGGCGPLQGRVAKNREAARELVRLYPGCFRYKERPGRWKESEVVMKKIKKIPCFSK